MRSYDPDIIQEPTIYRLTEVCMHYGESLKEINNEKFGDGIMSAIDFKLTVDKVKGSQKEDRVVITMNGKFLPHIEKTLVIHAVIRFLIHRREVAENLGE